MCAAGYLHSQGRGGASVGGGAVLPAVEDLQDTQRLAGPNTEGQRGIMIPYVHDRFTGTEAVAGCLILCTYINTMDPAKGMG